MRFIKAFQVLPEGRAKDRIRCAFYNRRMRRYVLSIARLADGFDVRYRDAQVIYDSNPYYKGLATVAGYFGKGGPHAGDTVVDAGPTAIADRTATGFVFREDDPQALRETLGRACDAYRQPALWAQLVDTGMRQDWSWRRSAGEYVRLYERILHGSQANLGGPGTAR